MKALLCGSCGFSCPLSEPVWRCGCGHPLDIRFTSSLDPDLIAGRKPSLWRYREALPIDSDEFIVTMEEGFTPLVEAPLGPKELLLKLEFLFPTGSFKDRGAAVLISKAREIGIGRIVEDSSGNAGCAIAAYAARAGMRCDILVPETASRGKLAQIEMYGANLRTIPGTREDTAAAALEAAKEAYYASHSWNPFFFQGTKTFAFEVWEQMGFDIPDTILLPTGNGTLFIGAYLGFRDLLENGRIRKIPRLVAVQAERCAPIHRMFRDRLDSIPFVSPAKTIAEGVAIREPVRGKEIVRILRETGGDTAAVTEAEVREAVMELGRAGIYAEPTAAVAYAAYRKTGPRHGVTVVPVTGHGLKSTDTTSKPVKKSL